MAHFDLAILGTGSGNSLVTPDFDDAKVAVVEKNLFGGTCLNAGCIPTKMFVYASEVAATARDSQRYGVDAHVDGVRWGDIRDRVFGRIDPIEAAGRDYRINGPNTTAFLGHARFVGEREIEVELNGGGIDRFTADRIVIATGSRPAIPEPIRESGVAYHTSDDIMRLPKLPRSLVIYGGGVIAVEFAHIFHELGVDVTVVARGPRLLRSIDEEISLRFTQLAKKQWNVRTNATVASARSTAGGVRVDLSDGGYVEAEALLVATGRTPNADQLNASAGGVELTQDGRVAVDTYGRTSAAGVWALGDVSSPYQLKHVANAEARAVAHNLVHPESLTEMPHKAVPSGVFSKPQLAGVGATQQALEAAGIPFVVKVQDYGDTAYGWAMEDQTSVLKVLADPKTRLILGAHCMGPDATTLIQPILMAMSMDIPADRVAKEQYWIHPALSEVVENALLGLEFTD